MGLICILVLVLANVVVEGAGFYACLAEDSSAVSTVGNLVFSMELLSAAVAGKKVASDRFEIFCVIHGSIPLLMLAQAFAWRYEVPSFTFLFPFLNGVYKNSPSPFEDEL